MQGNPWLYVALIAFLVFCCLPMLFMGRRAKHSSDADRTDRGNGSPEK